MADMILFPSDFFDSTKVDEDLEQEYEAVKATKLFETVLFDYDKWFNEGKLVIKHKPEKEHNAVYRGWMMKPEQYELFYHKLNENNINLITKPDEYSFMHIFPNVYESIKNDTAKIMVFPLHSDINVEQLKESFDRFMVKDYVKSEKGTEFPAYFDKNITQKDFERWMDVFYNYRGDLLTGGICIKEFLNLKRYGENTNEYRVFYMNNKIASVYRNSGQECDTPTVPEELTERYKNLPSPYYTIDYAELEDGSWKIIETGDGGVSGLPDNQNYEIYYKSMYRCFK